MVCGVNDKNSSRIIEDGAVFQRDGEIVDVGPHSVLASRYTPDEEVGSSDFIVIPGLVNAHHHYGMTPFQLGARDLALETWGPERWGDRDVDPYLDTLHCAMQMIESGITTVMHNDDVSRRGYEADLDEHSSDVLRAYDETGMRVAFSLFYADQNNLVYDDDDRFMATLPADLSQGIRGYLGSRRVSLEDYISHCAELIDRNRSKKIKIFISPGNVQWCSDMLLRELKDFATRHSTGVHIHLQETVYQKMYGERHWGKTPLAHLYDLGFLGQEVSCAHGVWLTDSDMDLLAETGTMISHNPSSNLRLKSGIAPLNRMLEKGVTVAIGIDEAGINDDNDILQEMRLAQKLHRVPGVSSPSPTSHQILHMATANGARATWLDDSVGTLKPGKRADMVLVNLERILEPYLAPETNMVDALLYRGRGLDVDTVIVDGDVLLRNRVFTQLDKEDIAARLKESLSVPLRPHETNRAELGRMLIPHVQRYFEEWPLEESAPHYIYNERTL